MINIEFDERSVFTYDAKNLTVHAWDHRDGWCKGPVIGQAGKIKFANETQLTHFMEMLEFIREKLKIGCCNLHCMPTDKLDRCCDHQPDTGGGILMQSCSNCWYFNDRKLKYKKLGELNESKIKEIA